MRVNCTTLSLQKHGNEPDEYEDSAYPRSFKAEEDQREFRCAVADGATETSFSRLWADLLVRGYVEQEPLQDSRKKWQEQIPSSDQPWYVEEKAQAGAYAAIVGLTVQADCNWSCEAVGDSCLVQVRAGKIILSFPLQTAEEFSNSPALICSKADAGTEIEPQKIESQWQDGDQFLLLTDAIARWLLTEPEKRLQSLLSLENDEQLLALAGEQRTLPGADGRQRLHNDDITIMKVEIK
jgi:Protein phosphatase 2C